MKIKETWKYLLLLVCLALCLSPVLPVKADEDQLDRQAIEELFSLDYDEGMFTVYAFINFTGFKDNNGMPFSSIRQNIRNDLEKMNLHLKDNQYYLNRGQEAFWYQGYLMVSNGPPLFEAVYFDQLDENQLNNMGFLSEVVRSDLRSCLAEFYEKADIASLYEKYRPDYEAEIARVRESTYEKIEYVYKVFHLDPKEARGKVVMDVNYLLEMGRAETWPDLPDYRRGGATWLQYGPNPMNQDDGSSAVHELMHTYVNPLLAKHKSKVNNFVLSNGIKSAGPYSTHQMVEEIFVRAIECLPAGRYVNYDTINFPRSKDIFDFFFSDFDPATENLETFILKALDAFTSQEIKDVYQSGYDKGLAQGLGSQEASAPEDRSLYKTWPSVDQVPIDKVWMLTVHLDLDLDSIREKNLFITDASGVIHPIFYLVDQDVSGSQVRLLPARDYRPGETYTLWIKDIKANNGKSLSQWTLMDFSIQEP